MTHRIVVSFSGGRTSAFMARWIQRWYPEAETLFIFANTGLEDEKTLTFVDRCDREWGLNLVWVEAVVDHTGHGHGHGTRHRVVDCFTAHRGWEVFEDVIKKYGIPNQSFNHCSRELKERPIHHYMRMHGLASERTAIGIRADEMDRMKFYSPLFWYQLVKANIHKGDILSWWKDQPFDLNLPEHLGNCVTCWKKSLRKLMTVAKERPAAFEFNRRMEALYSNAGAGGGNRRFFRGKKTADDLIAMAAKPFNHYVDSHQYRAPFINLLETIPGDTFPEMDLGGSCSESCEVGADESEESAIESWIPTIP